MVADHHGRGRRRHEAALLNETHDGNLVARRERLRGTGGAYGAWTVGTSACSLGGVIRIHGTDQPQLLPGRPSHAGVRVRNADLRRLVERMPNGTPIRIR